MDEAKLVTSLTSLMEELAKTPGAGAQRLAALTSGVDWSKVHIFELDWKLIGTGENPELVPVVKIEFIRD